MNKQKKEEMLKELRSGIRRKLIKSYLPNTTYLFEQKQAEWEEEVFKDMIRGIEPEGRVMED